MALSTFAELKAAIASWANRTNLTTQIPDFIALAEARMGADLSARALESLQEVEIVDGVATLPDNVVTVLGLKIVDATYPDVEVTSRERIEELTARGYTGDHTYAALIGREVHLYPDTDGTLEVYAKCRVPPLSDEATTNWVLTNHPNAYLFGSLMEVAEFTQGDPTRWERRYAEAIIQANQAGVYGGQMATSKVRGVR